MSFFQYCFRDILNIRYFPPILSFLSHTQTQFIRYRPVFFRLKCNLLKSCLIEFIAALKLSFLLSYWIFSIQTSFYSYDQGCRWQQLLLTNKNFLVRKILKAGCVFLNFIHNLKLWLFNFLMKFKMYVKKNKFSGIKYLLQTPNNFVFGLTYWCASENF